MTDHSNLQPGRNPKGKDQYQSESIVAAGIGVPDLDFSLSVSGLRPLEPFQEFQTVLSIVVKNQQGELLSKEELFNNLSRNLCVDQATGIVLLGQMRQYLASRANTAMEVPSEEIDAFTKAVANEFGLTAVHIGMKNESDFSQLALLPSKPVHLHIGIGTTALVEKAEGMQSTVTREITAAGIDLSDIESFRLYGPDMRESAGALSRKIAAGPLIEMLQTAPKLHAVRLECCDFTGTASIEGKFDRLESFVAKNGKGSPGDLARFVRATRFDLSQFDVSENRGFWGMLERETLAKELAALLSSSSSRTSNVTLPALKFDTNSEIIRLLSKSRIQLDSFTFHTVDKKGNPDSVGNAELAKRIRKIWPETRINPAR